MWKAQLHNKTPRLSLWPKYNGCWALATIIEHDKLSILVELVLPQQSTGILTASAAADSFTYHAGEFVFVWQHLASSPHSRLLLPLHHVQLVLLQLLRPRCRRRVIAIRGSGREERWGYVVCCRWGIAASRLYNTHNTIITWLLPYTRVHVLPENTHVLPDNVLPNNVLPDNGSTGNLPRKKQTQFKHILHSTHNSAWYTMEIGILGCAPIKIISYMTPWDSYHRLGFMLHASWINTESDYHLLLLWWRGVEGVRMALTRHAVAELGGGGCQHGPPLLLLAVSGEVMGSGLMTRSSAWWRWPDITAAAAERVCAKEADGTAEVDRYGRPSQLISSLLQ